MSDLTKKLAEVSDQIKGLESDAQAKWAAFEKARGEFAESGADASTTDSDQFKSAHEAHAAYGEVKDRIQALEQVRTGILEMGAKSGPAAYAPKQETKAQENAIGNLASLMADRILSGEGMKGLDEAATSSAPLGTRLLGKGLDAAETKTLLYTGGSTSAGTFLTPQRVGYVPDPQRRRTVLDLLTMGTTNTSSVQYARQSAFSNNAAQVPEATATSTGTKPEATIAFTLITETVKTVANWIPASRQALADAGQLRMIIEQQLRYALEKYTEEQIINGAGTGGDFTGILNTSGILTQAKSSDSVPDAIHKGLTQIRLGYIEPNGVVMHPNDWEVVRLGKDSYGGYYYGPPALAGQEQIWGLPVVVTAACPDDTSIVGDFRQAAMWIREGVQVLASDSHSDFFTKNLVAILAEFRAAFGVLMPKAFCQITGVD